MSSIIARKLLFGVGAHEGLKSGSESGRKGVDGRVIARMAVTRLCGIRRSPPVRSKDGPEAGAQVGHGRHGRVSLRGHASRQGTTPCRDGRRPPTAEHRPEATSTTFSLLESPIVFGNQCLRRFQSSNDPDATKRKPDGSGIKPTMMGVSGSVSQPQPLIAPMLSIQLDT